MNRATEKRRQGKRGYKLLWQIILTGKERKKERQKEKKE
jgi:hypothetical protein